MNGNLHINMKAKLKIHTKNDGKETKELTEFGPVLGMYNHQKNTVNIYLSEIWQYRAGGCIDKFTTEFAKNLSHEFIHSEINKEIEDNNLNLSPLIITRQEWITKKINNEPLNEFSLMPNIYQDMKKMYLDDFFKKDILELDKKYTTWKIFRNIFYITMGIWFIMTILITIRMLV